MSKKNKDYKKPEKSTVMRILVLLIVAVIVLGIIIMPFL